MIRQHSWLDLAGEPPIRASGLDRLQERAPRLRVSVELSDGRLRLGFGKATLDLATAFTESDHPGQRAGTATILPPTAKDADAILAAIAGVADVEVPPRPHPPGLRTPLPVTLLGFH